MFYVIYILALLIGLYVPSYLVAQSFGFHISGFWDPISLFVTILAPYLFVVSSTSSFSFFNNNDHMLLWGDMSLVMGYIGFFIGMIGVLAGMNSFDIVYFTSSSAVAMLTILYGLIFKYLVITPWVTCKKNCK